MHVACNVLVKPIPCATANPQTFPQATTKPAPASFDSGGIVVNRPAGDTTSFDLSVGGTVESPYMRFNTDLRFLCPSGFVTNIAFVSTWAPSQTIRVEALTNRGAVSTIMSSNTCIDLTPTFNGATEIRGGINLTQPNGAR